MLAVLAVAAKLSHTKQLDSAIVTNLKFVPPLIDDHTRVLNKPTLAQTPKKVRFEVIAPA